MPKTERKTSVLTPGAGLEVQHEDRAAHQGGFAEAVLAFVLEALEEGKAREVVVLDVRLKTSMTDFMVVASGTSERHAKSIASHVAEAAKKQNVPPVGVEGDDVGEWVLVDLGVVIVHVMKPQIRDFYQLEKLWRCDFAGEDQSRSLA